LNRGNLVVHGDVPKRSPSETEHISSPDWPDETSDAHHQVERELPAPSTTRNLLSKFKALEDSSAVPPTPEQWERTHSVTRSGSRASRTQRLSTSDGENDSLMTRSNGIDIDAEAAVDAGEFENQPIYDPSLVRESDRTDEAELPERGTTRGLLAKFQLLQQHSGQ
jgi:hypothetical protein